LRRSLFQAYFGLMRNTKIEDECWVKKQKVKHRPTVKAEGKRYLATRVVLFVHEGLNPDLRDKYACHTCDNPYCYNPWHLYIGDASTNALDREDELLGRVRKSARLPR